MPQAREAAYAARLRKLYGFDKACVVTEDGTPLHEQGCPNEPRHDDDHDD